MNLLQQFLQCIQQEKLFTKKDKLLLAVSGGVDSAVLCELCYQSAFQFTLAHCNFNLRGEESERDEQFVRSLGDRYNTKVLVKSFDTEEYAAEHKLSIQVAARELRYSWFDELMDTQGKMELSNDKRHPANASEPGNQPLFFNWVLTAHHADDNIETMLMNFFKGTGLTGLKGILPRQGKILRPLLFVHKEAIIRFAGEHKVSFVEDSSNASEKYTRNYFRNQLIPAVAKVFPQVRENLSANLHRFREGEQLYLQAIDRHKKKLLEFKGNEVHIPVLKLKRSVPLATITYEIIKDYGFSAAQTGEVLHLLDGESGKFVKSGLFRIIKNRGWLIIAPDKTEKSGMIIIDEETTKLSFEEGTLEFKALAIQNAEEYPQRQLHPSVNIAHLDSESIRFPLLLRKRAMGDYFYPLGMSKKKKLSRFLSDQKASLTEKEKVWVLEMNKKIIWVIGRRIDDRLKITTSTRKIFQINFTPGVKIS